MNRTQLADRVLSLTRDFGGTTFRKIDIVNFLNEGIDRCAQVIDELRDMAYLLIEKQEVGHLPRSYHHILALYAASRCYHQDEQHYQAGTLMNEFEMKLANLKESIELGDVVIVDPETGIPVDSGDGGVDYVSNTYFLMKAVDD